MVAVAERHSVLVVDDEPQVLVALEDLLSDDYRVLKCGSPERAVGMAEDAPNLAVVLSDQRMPRMTGDQLLAELRSRTDATRVLVTGYSDLTAVVRAVNDGQIFAYVSKPWDPNTLKLTVDRAAEYFRLHRELERERKLLADLLASVPDGMYLKDQELRFQHANRAYQRFLAERQIESDGLLGKRLSEVWQDDEAVRIELEERNVLETHEAIDEVLHKVPVGNGYRWHSKSIALVRDPQGHIQGVVGVLRDVTERKEQEERVAILSRVRAVLGEVNGTIVRIRDRGMLIGRCCEIAVGTGGIPLAMVYHCESGGLGTLVASAGHDDDVLGLVREEQDERRFVPGTSVMGLLTAGRAALLDAREVPDCGGVGAALARLGYQSVAALPLTVSSRLEYVLVLATKDPEFFDTQEVALLHEVASNVAFALEHDEQSRRLNLLLSYDELTGLSRRELFVDRLQQRLAACNPAEAFLAVVWLDISRFRRVNESLGRAGGDVVLRELAERLARAVGDRDLIARVDANAFALLSPQLKQEAAVTAFLSRVRAEVLDAPFEVDGTELRLSATIGVAMFPTDAQAADPLLFQAETAGKAARTNKQAYLFYASTMNERVADKLAMETRLRRAIENREFVLHYQPKVKLETGAVTGVEALVRWNDPENGLIPPGAFIPILEETGLILDVGRWVLVEAVVQQISWQRVMASPPRIAVNVSAVQLAQEDFVSTVRELLDAYPSAARQIDIELTESVVMSDFDSNVEKLKVLRSLGVGIALDDFGTGYSSLGYLRRLPTDVLKIDRSFVTGMDKTASDMTIVSTVITLAHSLGLRVVAEGVETTNQARLLGLLLCDEIQGYLIAKPLPPEGAAELFARRYSFEGG